MKILMIRDNQGYPDSRVEKELFSLSKEHDIELLGWDRTRDSDKIIDKYNDINGKKILYHLIGIKAPFGEGYKKIFIPMLKFWKAVNKYLKENIHNYDVIHFCDFDTAALSVKLAQRSGKKVVYDIFDYYADAHACPDIVAKIIKKSENNIINRSDLTIICSEKRLEQIYPAVPKKYIVVHNSPSREMHFTNFELDPKSDKNKFKLVYVGLLSDDRFLRNIGNVISKHPEIEWHVGGMGILDEYFKNLSKNYSNVFYYGKLNYADALTLENKCDIMTAIYAPSLQNHKYAAPNKFYESLMLGKPLIMVKNTGMDEIVSKYNIGAVINNAEDFENQFEKCLIELRDSPDKKHIEETENKLYEEKYSWKIMENRLLGAYDKLK